jgi:hypothetical protein
MTELRQKMIRAMDLKNLSPHSKRTYLAAVTGLAKHYRQFPDKITDQMIEDYLLYLKNEKPRSFLNRTAWTLRHPTATSSSRLFSDAWFPKEKRSSLTLTSLSLTRINGSF